MIRSTFGNSLYTAGEDDVVLGTAASWTGDQPNGVIYCHGGNATAATAIGKTEQRTIMSNAARHATVHCGDLGGDTFGNNTGLLRVEQAVAYLRSTWGQDGPVVLVGASMGFITATVYTLHHPDEVLAIAGIIPGIDMQSLINDGGMGSQINPAYGGSYNDATDGPTHSPIQFADQLPDDLPIHLFTASNDPVCLPAVTVAWLTIRPQDGHTNIGALGHTDAAIGAAVVPATAFVLPFITPSALP